MNYLKQLILLAISTCIVGCNLNNSDSGLSGLWLSEDGKTHLHISDTKLVEYLNYNLDDSTYCQTKVIDENVTIEEESIRSQGSDTGYPYTLSEDKLTLHGYRTSNYISAEQGRVYRKSPISFDKLNFDCSLDNSSEELVISVKFPHLTDSVLLNKGTEHENELEFSISVEIDLDQNNILDLGDISFTIYHINDPNTEYEFRDIESLSTNFRIHTLKSWLQKNQTQDFWISQQELNYSFSEKRIIIVVPKSSHIALSLISVDTPIRISTQYINRDSGVENDYFPNGEFLSSIFGQEDVSDEDHMDRTSIIDFTEIYVGNM